MLKYQRHHFSQSSVLQELNSKKASVLTFNNLNSVYDESDLSVGGYFTGVGVTILRW